MQEPSPRRRHRPRRHPPLFETTAVLGKEICRTRFRKAMEVLRYMGSAIPGTRHYS